MAAYHPYPAPGRPPPHGSHVQQSRPPVQHVSYGSHAPQSFAPVPTSRHGGHVQQPHGPGQQPHGPGQQAHVPQPHHPPFQGLNGASVQQPHAQGPPGQLGLHVQQPHGPEPHAPHGGQQSHVPGPAAPHGAQTQQPHAPGQYVHPATHVQQPYALGPAVQHGTHVQQHAPRPPSPHGLHLQQPQASGLPAPSGTYAQQPHALEPHRGHPPGQSPPPGVLVEPTHAPGPPAPHGTHAQHPHAPQPVAPPRGYPPPPGVLTMHGAPAPRPSAAHKDYYPVPGYSSGTQTGHGSSAPPAANSAYYGPPAAKPQDDRVIENSDEDPSSSDGESCENQADQKKESKAMALGKIEDLFPEDVDTVMIRNIPCACDDEEVLGAVAAVGFGGLHTYFHLPKKSTSRRRPQNIGYAFITFNDAALVRPFARAMIGFRFPNRDSSKLVSVVPAHIQGGADPRHIHKTVAERSEGDKGGRAAKKRPREVRREKEKPLVGRGLDDPFTAEELATLDWQGNTIPSWLRTGGKK